MLQRTTRLPFVLAVSVNLMVHLTTGLVASSGFAQTAEGNYHDVIAEAVAEFKLGHWPEAAALFKQAHALKPSAKTARGLGIVYFESREYTLAVKYLQEALSAGDGALSADQAQDSQQVLDRALRFTGVLKVATTPTDASVFVDGVRLEAPAKGARLNAGSHTLSVNREDYRGVERPIRIEGGARDQSVSVQLAPLAGPELSMTPTPHLDNEPSSSTPAVLETLGWVSGGLAVAAGVTGLVLWRVDQDGPVADFRTANCNDAAMAGPKCPEYSSEHESVQSAARISGVLAGVFAVTSATFFILSLTGGDDSDDQAIACGASFTSVGCLGRF